MGLLRSAYLLILPAALGIWGCGGIRLERPPATGAVGWTQDGGGPPRRNSVPDTLTPPLRELWVRNVGAGVGKGSPLAADGLVFAGNLRGELHVLDAATGDRLGSQDFGESMEGSPALGGGVVFAGLSNTERSLLAFDPAQGRILWSRACGEIESAVLFYEGAVIAGTTSGEIVSVEAETGREKWRFAIPRNRARKGFRSSPAASRGIVAAGGEDGFIYGLDAATGMLRWTYEAGAPVSASPCLEGGTLIAGDESGVLHALSLEDGTHLWRHDTGDPIAAGATSWGRAVIQVTTAGRMMALCAGDGRMLWMTDLGSPPGGPAVAAGGVLYAGTLGKELLAVDAESGRILWRHPLPGRMKTAPALSGGRLYVATDERSVIALEPVPR
ncbi:MAG: PQQ-binding-like beta-propeller repeat protein [Bacteroidota bacterium]